MTHSADVDTFDTLGPTEKFRFGGRYQGHEAPAGREEAMNIEERIPSPAPS